MISPGSSDFKVLFVYPNMLLMNMLPPAIALFSALLKREGFEVELFDTTYHVTDESFNSDKEKERHMQVRPFNLEGTKIQVKQTNVMDDFMERVEAFGPDLIAMSCVEDTFPLGMRLLRAIRSYDVPVIVGGVFATFAPEKVIRREDVDIVCVGEGERALVELCRRMSRGMSYDDIPNLWVKSRDGHIARNPLGARVDINALPMPDFTLFEEARLYRPMAGRVYRMIPFETHRGCPYLCSFCNSPSQNTLYRDNLQAQFFRKRSMDSIRKEIDFLIHRWRVEYMYFTADTFLAWNDREFDEFIDMYSGYKLPFWCQTRPETITPHRMEKLKSVGIHRMSIGLEHGNEKFRREVVKRPVSNDVIVRAFAIAADYAIPISVNNIVGFPDEDRALAFDTIAINRRITIDTGNCYAFTPFHGTPLRDRCVAKGYLDDSMIATCLTQGSMLSMPRFPKEQIYGIMRTFNLYVRYPKSRWPEIERAEKQTPEGNAVFERLREEFIAEFYAGESVS